MELQIGDLISAIKKDGVDAAQAESERILAQAKKQAAEIVAAAKEEAEPRRLYGEYKNVALSDREYSLLLEDLGREGIELYIKKADEYMEETGKSYKRPYFTIKRWYKEDKERAAPKKKVKTTAFSNYTDTVKRDYGKLEKEILEKMLKD